MNSRDKLPMFKAEAKSLAAIGATNTIRVPQPLLTGQTSTHSYIIMEHIELHDNGNCEDLAHELADMHRCTHLKFGFHINNTIGTTPQFNTQESSWLDFFREHRLDYQFRLADRNGLRISKSSNLLDGMGKLFDGYTPLPSLLHGDLWGGNVSYTKSGMPVIYDPASYYGDREADLAMTELFGGFSSRFIDAYNEAWPIDDGYEDRKMLYNLYHILNHYNLFGGNYGQQAWSAVDYLVRKL